jgi:ABC-2 type transport system ATP-binding protein
MSIIKIQALNKDFFIQKKVGFFNTKISSINVLSNFNLEIHRPQIYGLVGPNGAGKTTLIKLCLGLIEKSSGIVEILGFDPTKRESKFLQSVGLISGNNQSFESRLPAIESLRFQGALYNLNPEHVEKRIHELSSLFKITDKLDIALEKLSLGQKMKFEIISKVLHSPKILFLDEPTLGLDFEAQSMMHELILDLHKGESVTIVLTSHYLPDITKLCSKFSVIEAGQNVFTGTFKELQEQTNNQGYLKTLVNELNK